MAKRDYLNNPHDKFFKAFFQEKQTVIDYLNHFFPYEITKLLNLDSLKLDTTDYITSELSEYFSDVVYKTKIDSTQLKIALLFEHKRRITKEIFPQLMDYMLSIWKNDLETKNPFTVIIPIVVFQSKNNFKPKKFIDYFPNLPISLHRFIPQFDYHFTHIQAIDDKEILNLNDKSLLRSLLLVAKYVDEFDKIRQLGDEVFKFISKQPYLIDFSKRIIVYLSNSSDTSKEDVKNYINNLSSPINQLAMTAYQEIKLEGKLEGKLEQAAETVRQGLSMGCTIEQLIKLSQLSKEQVLQIIENFNKKNLDLK